MSKWDIYAPLWHDVPAEPERFSSSWAVTEADAAEDWAQENWIRGVSESVFEVWVRKHNPSLEEIERAYEGEAGWSFKCRWFKFEIEVEPVPDFVVRDKGLVEPEGVIDED